MTQDSKDTSSVAAHLDGTRHRQMEEDSLTCGGHVRSDVRHQQMEEDLLTCGGHVRSDVRHQQMAEDSLRCGGHVRSDVMVSNKQTSAADAADVPTSSLDTVFSSSDSDVPTGTNALFTPTCQAGSPLEYPDIGISSCKNSVCINLPASEQTLSNGKIWDIETQCSQNVVDKTSLISKPLETAEKFITENKDINFTREQYGDAQLEIVSSLAVIQASPNDTVSELASATQSRNLEVQGFVKHSSLKVPTLKHKTSEVCSAVKPANLEGIMTISTAYSTSEIVVPKTSIDSRPPSQCTLPETQTVSFSNRPAIQIQKPDKSSEVHLSEDANFSTVSDVQSNIPAYQPTHEPCGIGHSASVEHCGSRVQAAVVAKNSGIMIVAQNNDFVAHTESSKQTLQTEFTPRDCKLDLETTVLGNVYDVQITQKSSDSGIVNVSESHRSYQNKYQAHICEIREKKEVCVNSGFSTVLLSRDSEQRTSVKDLIEKKEVCVNSDISSALQARDSEKCVSVKDLREKKLCVNSDISTVLLSRDSEQCASVKDLREKTEVCVNSDISTFLLSRDSEQCTSVKDFREKTEVCVNSDISTVLLSRDSEYCASVKVCCEESTIFHASNNSNISPTTNNLEKYPTHTSTADQIDTCGDSSGLGAATDDVITIQTNIGVSQKTDNSCLESSSAHTSNLSVDPHVETTVASSHTPSDSSSVGIPLAAGDFKSGIENVAMDSTSNVQIAMDSTSNVQIAMDSTSNVQTAMDSTSNVQIAMDSTSNVQIAMDSTSNVQIAMDSTSNVQIAMDSTSNVQTAMDSTSNVQTAMDSTSNVQIAMDSTSNVQIAMDSTSNVQIARDSTSNVQTELIYTYIENELVGGQHCNTPTAAEDTNETSAQKSDPKREVTLICTGVKNPADTELIEQPIRENSQPAVDHAILENNLQGSSCKTQEAARYTDVRFETVLMGSCSELKGTVTATGVEAETFAEGRNLTLTNSEITNADTDISNSVLESSSSLKGGSKEIIFAVHCGSQEITPSLLVRSQEITPSVHGGSQEITPAVQGGRQEITPAVHGGSQEITPSVPGGSQDITPSVLVGSQEIAPAVHGGSQEITPAVPGGSQDITPSVLVGSQEITPAVHGGNQEITPAVHGGSQEITPSVPGGSQDITPSVLVGSQEMTPAVLVGSQEMTPAVLVGSQEMTPAVLVGSHEMTPAVHGGSQEITPAVHGGSQEITPAIHGGSQEITPAVLVGSQEMTPAVHGGSQEITPSVLVGSQEITPAVEGESRDITPIKSISVCSEKCNTSLSAECGRIDTNVGREENLKNVDTSVGSMENDTDLSNSDGNEINGTNLSSSLGSEKNDTSLSSSVGNEKNYTSLSMSVGNEKNYTDSNTSVGNEKNYTSLCTSVGNEKNDTNSSTSVGNEKNDTDFSIYVSDGDDTNFSIYVSDDDGAGMDVITVSDADDDTHEALEAMARKLPQLKIVLQRCDTGQASLDNRVLEPDISDSNYSSETSQNQKRSSDGSLKTDSNKDKLSKANHMENKRSVKKVKKTCYRSQRSDDSDYTPVVKSGTSSNTARKKTTVYRQKFQPPSKHGYLNQKKMMKSTRCFNNKKVEKANYKSQTSDDSDSSQMSKYCTSSNTVKKKITVYKQKFQPLSTRGYLNQKKKKKSRRCFNLRSLDSTRNLRPKAGLSSDDRKRNETASDTLTQRIRSFSTKLGYKRPPHNLKPKAKMLGNKANESSGDTLAQKKSSSSTKLRQKQPPEPSPSPPLNTTLPFLEVDLDIVVEESQFFEPLEPALDSIQPLPQERKKRGRKPKHHRKVANRSESSVATVSHDLGGSVCDPRHSCCQKTSTTTSEMATQWEDPSKWYAALETLTVKAVASHIKPEQSDGPYSPSAPQIPDLQEDQNYEQLHQHYLDTYLYQNSSQHIPPASCAPLASVYSAPGTVWGMQGNLIPGDAQVFPVGQPYVQSSHIFESASSSAAPMLGNSLHQTSQNPSSSLDSRYDLQQDVYSDNHGTHDSNNHSQSQEKKSNDSPTNSATYDSHNHPKLKKNNDSPTNSATYDSHSHPQLKKKKKSNETPTNSATYDSHNHPKLKKNNDTPTNSATYDSHSHPQLKKKKKSNETPTNSATYDSHSHSESQKKNESNVSLTNSAAYDSHNHPESQKKNKSNDSPTNSATYDGHGHSKSQKKKKSINISTNTPRPSDGSNEAALQQDSGKKRKKSKNTNNTKTGNKKRRKESLQNDSAVIVIDDEASDSASDVDVVCIE